MFGSENVKVKLEELQPGLFMTPTGDCLDFTDDTPKDNNYRLTGFPADRGKIPCNYFAHFPQ